MAIREYMFILTVENGYNNYMAVITVHRVPILKNHTLPHIETNRCQF